MSLTVTHSDAGPDLAVTGGKPLDGALRLSLARRLQDGHWTLAFASEELCLEALRVVADSAQRLRTAAAEVLSPLVQ